MSVSVDVECLLVYLNTPNVEGLVDGPRRLVKLVESDLWRLPVILLSHNHNVS